jgi:hypothetical protein
MGPNIVVLKQGKEGASLFSKKNETGLKVPAISVDEIDPTGAGDSFGGAFMAAYLAKTKEIIDWTLEKILRFANIVGALKVKNFGPMANNSYQEVMDVYKKIEK